MAVRTLQARAALLLLATATLGAVGLSGCGSGGAAGVTKTATVTVTESPTPSRSILSSTASSASTRSADSDVGSDGTSTGAGATPTSTGILPPSATGRPLTLSDFFQPTSDWQENRYDIAGKSQLQGIGTEVSSCQPTYGTKDLQLRLGNAFETLNFSVGQADDSDASDQNLTVAVIANNIQIDIQRVPFNQIKQLTEPVAGVNALNLRFYLDSQIQSCGQKSVTGVLSGATLS